MLVKNECQANNKKVSWSTEKEKTNKRKGWKGTTKRERERERERLNLFTYNFQIGHAAQAIY